MRKMIQQQREGDPQDRYVLRGEGFVWPVVRSVLIFLGLLPVWVTFAMLILDGEFDVSGLKASFALGWPLGIVNTLLLCVLYFLKIDRKPLATAIGCFLECLLFLFALILVAWGQNYVAGILWHQPVEVLFWYSEVAAVLFTVLIVFSFYLIKKWIVASSN